MSTVDSPWNSLEAAKLVISSLTPLALALLGIYIHRVTKRFENQQWLNQRLVEKRLKCYEEIAPLLNDLLCYFTFVGCWKELDPPAIVKIKRDLDKKIHIAAPLFPNTLAPACKAFMDICFSTYTGWSQDAKMNTPTAKRKVSQKWEEGWDKHFSDQHADPKEIQRLYCDIMSEFTTSFGELDYAPTTPVSRLPRNIT